MLDKSREATDEDANERAKEHVAFGYFLIALGGLLVATLLAVGRDFESGLFVPFVVMFSGISVAGFGKKLRAGSRKKSNGDHSNTLIERIQAYGVGPKAKDIMAKDHRRPVLYLRSFEDEAHRASAFGRFDKYWHGFRGASEGFYLVATKRIETKLLLGPYRQRSMRRSILGSTRSMFDEQLVFAEFMDLIGPYVAIGRPGEVFSNMDLGAAKEYVDDADWQRVVVDWIKDSAAIVLDVGTSKGFLWEIDQVVRAANPKRVLMILPWQQKHYESFVAATSGISPSQLPTMRPRSRLMTFGLRWEPNVLVRPDDDISLEGTLRPFVKQNGFTLHRIH